MTDLSTYFENGVSPIEASVFNAWGAEVQGVRDETVSARDVAVEAAEGATAPTDEMVSSLIDAPGSQTRGSLDALYSGADGISVIEYGAHGDGVNDDRAAITAAIAAAAAVGKPVLFPAGTYILSGDISVPSDMTLTGVQGRSILKSAQGSTSTRLLMLISSSDNVLIQGLTFDGNMDADASFATAVTVYQSSRVRFDRCEWRNVKGISINLSTSVSLSGLTNCHFEDCGTWHKTSGVLTDRKQGIAFSSGAKETNYGNYVTGCSFREIGLDAVSFTAQNDFLLEGNVLYSNYAGGFYANSCSNLRIHHNHVTGNPTTDANGIDVANCDQVSITGNTAIGRGAGGILIAGVTNATIVANVCINNFQNASAPHKGGIVVTGYPGGCTNITISGNVCTDTQSTKTQLYGVHMDTVGTHVNVVIDASNRLIGNKTANIGGGGAWSGAEWQAWTPTLSGMAGTVTARYSVVGSTCHSMFQISPSSITAAAASFTLPLTSARSGIPVGPALAVDVSPSARYTGGAFLLNATTASAIFASSSYVSGSTPFTWASGDVLYIAGSYEIAQ